MLSLTKRPRGRLRTPVASSLSQRAAVRVGICVLSTLAHRTRSVCSLPCVIPDSPVPGARDTSFALPLLLMLPVGRVFHFEARQRRPEGRGGQQASFAHRTERATPAVGCIFLHQIFSFLLQSLLLPDPGSCLCSCSHSQPSPCTPVDIVSISCNASSAQAGWSPGRQLLSPSHHRHLSGCTRRLQLRACRHRYV